MIRAPMQTRTAQPAPPRVATASRPLPVSLAFVVSIVAVAMSVALTQLTSVSQQALVIGTIVMGSLVGWIHVERADR
jgi:hypothetical protein